MNANSRRLPEDLALEVRRRILEAHRASNPLRPPSTQGIKGTERRENFAPIRSEKQEVTVTLKLTEQEATAIHVYAKICGESIPELIRKALIREATLSDGYGADDPQYGYDIKLPDEYTSPWSISSSYSYTNQRQQLEDTYNHIRSILGWRKIKL